MNSGFLSSSAGSSAPASERGGRSWRLSRAGSASWERGPRHQGMQLGVLFFVAIALASLGRAANASNWSVRVWAPQELADDPLVGVAPGADGFLWAATPTRLVSFDGGKFNLFPSSIFASDSVPRIRLLLGAGDGTLWIALGDGRIVHIMHRRQETFREGLPAAWPEVLVEDGEGALWVSYRFGLLARIKGGKVTTFGREVSDTGGRITLAVDAAGAVWSAQRGEISVFREGRFQRRAKLTDVSTRLARADGGGLWIYSGDALFRFREGGTPVLMARATGRGTTLFEDREGAVWIGTVVDGLQRYGPHGLERVPTSSREIIDVREDAEGNIWVATRGGGLNQVRRRTITLEGAVTSLPDQAVQAVCEDAYGEIWASMADGSFMHRVGQAWQPVPEGERKIGLASALAADPAGGLWIGTGSNQLHHWTKQRLTTLGREDGLACHAVRALLVGRDGTLWVAGRGPNTLQALSGGRLRNIALPRPALGVSALAEDAAGTLWLGTTEGYVLRVEGDRAVEEPAFAPLGPGGSRYAIRSLQAFPDGSVWVAYYGAGIARIKEGRYVCLRAEQGIRSDFIATLAADDRGYLWCGAAGKVLKFQRSELDALADGRISRIQPVEYGPDAGLPALVPNPMGAGVAVRTRDGRLWMPMGNVLVIADPSVSQMELPAARPIVTGLEIDGTRRAEYRGLLTQATDTVADLGRPGRLHFAAPRQTVTFTFAATSLASPTNVAFRHRLVGFDETWMESDGRRVAAYPRLPPGDYQFEVMACNSAGQWTDAVAAVGFTIDRRYWQTNWFAAVMLTLFTLAVVWLVRAVSLRRMQRNLRLAEEQAALGRERARIARDIHDDVGNRLTQILLWSGLAQRDVSHPARTVEHLQRISGSAAEITDALDEIVWAVNPRNDTLSHLIDYLGTFAVEFLRSAGIRGVLSLPSTPVAIPLSAEARHHVFLVTKEALANIVRHAEATEVRIEVSLQIGVVCLSLADNGRGFAATPDNATADGLRNMRSRMEEIGGTCEITSEPGAGTRVACTFPCPGLLHPNPPAPHPAATVP